MQGSLESSVGNPALRGYASDPYCLRESIYEMHFMSTLVCVCLRLNIFCSSLLLILRVLRVLRGCNLDRLSHN